MWKHPQCGQVIHARAREHSKVSSLNVETHHRQPRREHVTARARSVVLAINNFTVYTKGYAELDLACWIRDVNEYAKFEYIFE